MTEADKAERILRKVDAGNRIGVPQELALRVLQQDTAGDEWFSMVLNDAVTKTGTESAEAILRLLYCYGVGQIVSGRLN